jgi:hypothetical protein
MNDKEILELKRQNRNLKRHLKDLVNSTQIFLDNMDIVMKRPSTPERGEMIAKQCNDLDMANQIARHFGLGVPFKDKSLNPPKK